jgi:BlaI family transcriptional regulator, penicillinase repressor
MGNDALTISESEREVMMVLWDCESATVREIRERLAANGRQWAHTTINTLLTRLEQKHCVTCDRTGFAHVFAAAVSRDELVQQRLASLADEFCDGTRVPLMLALVDGQKFSDDEIDQFRDLLDQLESSRRKRSGGKGRKR